VFALIGGGLALIGVAQARRLLLVVVTNTHLALVAPHGLFGPEVK
jgi:hypothetical protein